MDKSALIKLFSRFERPDVTNRETNFNTLGLKADHAPLLVELVLEEANTEEEAVQWIPIYAWRALKALHTPVDVAPLLTRLEAYQDNTFALDELPDVIAQAGERAIAPTVAYIQNFMASELTRSLAVGILPKIAHQHPTTKATISEQLTNILASSDTSTPELNGFIVAALIELKAIESLVVMNHAYQAGKVSEAIVGDWEDVELALGLRSERSTPRPTQNGDTLKPSQAPVLDSISNDEVFARLQEHLDYYGNDYAIQEVAGLDGLFAAVACAPKMIMPTEWLAAIWGGEEHMPEFPTQAELTIFIELVMKLFNQNYQHLQETKAFVASFMQSVNEDGEKEVNVVSWCEGFMRGVVLGQPPLIEIPNITPLLAPIALFGTDEGYQKLDRLTEEKIQHWASEIEPSVLKIRDWAKTQAPKLQPIVNEAKIGRNDPCTCGSGKKYKKCCGANAQ